MFQGTASSVGKSMLVTALGRILTRRGLRVAPFKAQNLALNADATPDGREIGRAQSLQARACKVLPEVAMNPILLKPEPGGVQLVVLGESQGQLSGSEYRDRADELGGVVMAALEQLRRRVDVVVIEGAGSPVELNLADHEIVNMFVARTADVPVVLVGDIERGGVFAQLVGTLALLPEADRARVRGLVINKMHGDAGMLGSALAQLEARTSVPVLGVIPHAGPLRLADEDWSPETAVGQARPARADEIDVAILALPHASNIDDFDALRFESGVVTRYVRQPADIGAADLVVVPGTKATLADLAWLRARKLEAPLLARAERGEPILGICGGCQMLGQTIADRDGVESTAGTVARGLGLLPLTTEFVRPKQTLRVHVRSTDAASPFGAFRGAQGYWIHAGRARQLDAERGAVEVRGEDDGAWLADGAIRSTVFGTMVHGLLDNAAPRRNLLRWVADLRDRAWTPGPPIPSVEDELDRLADVVESAIDMQAIARLLGGLGA